MFTLDAPAALQTGGIAGGITDGTPIVFRCVFKPTPSSPQTLSHLPADAPRKGRFDACVAGRAVPVVEAMTALVLQDFMQSAQPE